MKRGCYLILIASVIIFASFASAEIYFDPLHSLYNVGDLITTNITLSSNVDTIGFLATYLICGVNEIETHKSIIELNAGIEKKVDIAAVIDQGILGQLLGECYLRAIYGAGESRSQIFSISRGVDLEIKLESAIFNPGDTVNITGLVLKRNREALTGNIEITIEGINVRTAPLETQLETTSEQPQESVQQEQSEDTSTEDTNEESLQEVESTGENSTENDDESIDSEENLTDTQETAQEQVEVQESVQQEQLVDRNITLSSIFGEVKDGFFSISFRIPENAPTGVYNIRAVAYDKDRSGLLMNKGENSKTFRVRQVLTDLDIALSSNTIHPENEFVYTPLLYDQAGSPGEGDIELNIYSPNKKIFLERIIKSNVADSIYIAANFTPGFWEISARMADFEKTRLFFVEEFVKLGSSLQNNQLLITNLGNVKFEGPIEVKIGNKSEVKSIELDVGESTSFRLEAPDGEYTISVSDGSNMYDLGRTFLTGNAIGIGQSGLNIFDSLKNWLWTLIIVILLIIALILIRKFVKRRFVGRTPKSLSPNSSLSLKSSTFTQTVKEEKPSPSLAPSNLMNSGEKQDASVIALKIKNLEVLKSSTNEAALESIEKALMKAKSANAKIYVENDYRVIIFIPKITKENENEVRAINAAKEIESILRGHNRLFQQKIHFGIGVHSGQIGVEMSKANQIKFVSLDNTLSIAKRIADHSDGPVYISEPLHKKVVSKIRAEKLQGTGFWVLKK